MRKLILAMLIVCLVLVIGALTQGGYQPKVETISSGDEIDGMRFSQIDPLI